MSVDLYVDSVVARAKVVIVRCLGGLDYWRYGLERIADAARDNGILFAALPGDDRADPRLAAMSTMPAAARSRCSTASSAKAGRTTSTRRLRFAGTLLGRDDPWQPPVAVGPITVLGEASDDAAGRAGRLLSRQSRWRPTIEPVTALMAALDREGLAPLARRREQPQGSCDRGSNSRS